MTADPPPEKAKGFFANVASLVSARFFLAISQILVLPIVARYLTVEEFAVMAMAMVVIAFCSVLSDGGLGRSLIRAEIYDHDEWSSVFWMLVGVGLGLAGIVLLMGPVWANFFEQPQLVAIMAALAIVPLCQSISAVANAEIERRENYTAIARAQMITTVVSLGLAVWLALLGAGVWALVGQQIVLAVVRLIGILYLTRFRPTFTFQPKLLSGHFKFARDALTVSAISATGSQAAVVAIGKFLGDGPLGIFSMSARFSRMPQYGLAGPMSTVVYVRMAKAQRDHVRVVAIYLAAARIMAAILFPILAMVAVAGTAIFTVLLSETWAPVAPVFAFSIMGLAVEAIAVLLLACIFRALNHTELHVRLTMEGAVLRTVLVVASAYFFSLEAVALSITIWGLIIVPRGWQLAQRIIPLSMSDATKCLAPSAGIALLMVAAHTALRTLLVPSHLAEIGLAAVILMIGYGCVFLADRTNLRQAVSIFKS